MRTNSRINHGLAAFAILAILSFVFLAGCLGQSTSNPGSESSQSGVAPAGYYSDGATKGVAMPQPNLAAPVSTGTSSYNNNVYTNLSDRKVIMSASVQMETSDHDKVVNSIRTIATSSGGYIESSGTYLSTNDKKHTTLTLKVPQSAYESDLAQIKALGKVKSESSSGQDVTRQYVDLSARLKNLKAEEQQLSDIMGMSRNVTEVLAVERELYRVRGDIESTQAQLNYLGSQVDFSTITVTVSEPEPVVGYDWGIDTAFKDGVHAFVSMIGALIVVTGYIIPLVLYLAIALVVLYFIGRAGLGYYRKMKKNRESKP